MQNNTLIFTLVLILIFYGRSLELCPRLFTDRILPIIDQTRCYTIGQCQLILNSSSDDDHHHHRRLISFERNNDTSYLSFSSNFTLFINQNHLNEEICFSLISKMKTIKSTNLSTRDCYVKRKLYRRQTRSGSTSSIVMTFNSSSFIDYRHREIIDYPLRLSVRFRTLGRISNGVLLSLTHRKSSSSIIPFIILDHTNGKIELTILQLDERNALTPVTTIQCGKNVNNDHWHLLQFEIDEHGTFTLVVDNDSRTSQVPSYVVSNWNINALLVGDTRRFNVDIFKPFIGYMSNLIFNDENLFPSLIKRNEQIKSSFIHSEQHITIGYRIAFFNLVTFDTQTSYIAVAERENQNKNLGKLEIYFLFRSYVPDGLIFYRYAQGLNEYFAMGLRAGILALFIDFGFGKRLVLSDESTKLADGKWHEVRVTRIGTDKIELVVDNRVNHSILSGNGIRNSVSLQPVLYIGGVPNSNIVNLTGSGLNSNGFQGCLSSFIVDGHLLDYQTALVKYGQVKTNVCSDSSDLTSTTKADLNKLCYDFTCIHSGVCKSNENDGPICDCLETGYTGERCDKLPNGFYFGKNHALGSVEYTLNQSQPSEQDTIAFGLQTLSQSVRIFQLESNSPSYNLEYEIVQGRSYIKLNFGEKQPDVYSAITHLTDGIYHSIKIIRQYSQIQLYVDGIKIDFESKIQRSSERRSVPAHPRLQIGSFLNGSHWNGIIAGLAFNRQSIFDSLAKTLIRMGDIDEVYPDEYTGQFNLINSSNMFTASVIDIPMETTSIPIIDNLYHSERMESVSPTSIPRRGSVGEWFSKQITRFGSRNLLIGLILASCFLLFLFFIIIRLHCTHRYSRRKKLAYKHSQSNGRTYSQLHHQNKRYSIAIPDGRASKKRVPKFLRYLHTNEAKPTSFRLSTNGGDSYHLISSIQDTKSLPYRNSDCVLNEHCCIHPSFSQPTPASPSTIYKELNRLMLSGSEPPLPLSHIAHSHVHPHVTATLRSLKKEVDNSSVQTYSAVYSCDLAANLDVEQDVLTRRSSMKRRSILKNTHSSLIQTKILFLYVKNVVDCYALQPNYRLNSEPILLATADENRIQLSHALTGSFHSQLPVSSLGSCHNLLFSYNGQFLIGLFYEITSNVNPYAVKIWSTEDYSTRTNLHPIKCSIALTSRQSSILYMAGKQKYGRGISLGLLDIDSCSLARELKSDPDTSIGDEIRRIILTKNETYALVACTEHTSSYTCFVVFKLEILSNEQSLSSAAASMTNCTMILTRFDSDPNHTFSINDDQQILTILRTNQILIWKLNDGEILFNYDFHHLNSEKKIQVILNCQMYNNHLFILVEQGLVHMWDVTLIMDQFSLISTIADPLIHSISWLDQRHFLSIDHDNQRIRIWNIYRKDVINEYLVTQGVLQTLHIHSITNDSHKRQEYLITGKSLNERNLLIFEYTQPYDDPIIDCSTLAVC